MKMYIKKGDFDVQTFPCVSTPIWATDMKWATDMYSKSFNFLLFLL